MTRLQKIFFATLCLLIFNVNEFFKSLMGISGFESMASIPIFGLGIFISSYLASIFVFKAIRNSFYQFRYEKTIHLIIVFLMVALPTLIIYTFLSYSLLEGYVRFDFQTIISVIPYVLFEALLLELLRTRLFYVKTSQ